ncbi:hypothetical protein KAS14_07505, partial [Candidatus Bathyarchaeota archaeon]|nr:hypothetical protein [Candidatus Bathyarchaeota archaeon]
MTYKTRTHQKMKLAFVLSSLLLLTLVFIQPYGPVFAQSPPTDWWVSGWELFDTDPDEPGTFNWRDVDQVWIKFDTNYLYLKLNTHEAGEKPAWNGPDYRDARYSFYFDVDRSTDPVDIHGTNIDDSEYKLFLEDYPK